MQANVRLWCAKCAEFRPHVTQAKYDTWGALSKQVERCTHCLTETQPGDGHEAPAADPPPVTLALTDMEISRARWVRYQIGRGVYSDDERGAA